MVLLICLTESEQNDKTRQNTKGLAHMRETGDLEEAAAFAAYGVMVYQTMQYTYCAAQLEASS